MSEGGEVERWDAWLGWVLPWLWACVHVLTINVPSEIFESFMRETMQFLTGHKFGGGGH